MHQEGNTRVMSPRLVSSFKIPSRQAD